MSSLLDRIKEGFLDTCYIWAKEMRNVFTDEGVLIFCIFVPLFYPLLYSWIYNNEVVREVPVAIVDRSYSSISREFVRQVDASPDVRVAYHCASLEEALQLTASHQVYGTLYFPEQFQNEIYRGEQTHVSVYTDMALMLTYKAIYQTSQAVSSRLNAEIQLHQAGGYTHRDDEITTKPLDFDEVPVFNTTGGYGNAILPGVLMLILQQTLLLGIGLAAGTARENNRFRELVPISKHYNGIFRIVLGKSLCYLMIYAVLGAYLGLVVPRLFSFTSLAHGLDLLAFMLPYILSCIFFGMVVSCLVRYRENVMLLVVFTSVIFLFMSGLSWPQSNISGFWQGIAALIPSTYGVRGFLRLSSMGATLGDVETEYIALWIQTLVYLFLTCAVYRYQIIIARRRAFSHMEMVKGKVRAARAARAIADNQ